MYTKTYFTNLAPNTNSLRHESHNTTHMVYEDELAVKLHAKDVEVGTSANGNLRQDQVNMRRVHSPGSANNESSIFVRIQNHRPMIAPLLNPS